MKKIKLNSAKLMLKKEFIGNLTDNEMANVIGGGETGYGMCNNFTQEGYTCNSVNNNTDCGGAFPSAGCDPSAACQSKFCTVLSIDGCKTTGVTYGAACTIRV